MSTDALEDQVSRETNSLETANDRQQLILVAGCFLLSGFAALLYETVWLRQFSINFGTSEQAIGIVLGTYMGGLALGSLVASRYANALRRPLLVYGLLELGIAISAMLVPVLLSLVHQAQVYFFGGVEEPPSAGSLDQVLFAFAGAFAATILPTTMMGATLPMLAKYAVRNDDHLGNRIGALYAINTAGAVVGTLTCAFVCLPNLGLSRTIMIGAGVNVTVFVVVWLIVRNERRANRNVEAKVESTETHAEVVAESASKKRRQEAKKLKEKSSEGKEPGLADSKAAEFAPRDWILVLILLSGAISFAYEIVFTRMIGHVLGGSVFSFAAMLASFLSGIAIGGAIASRLARRAEISALGFYYAQCGTMLLSLMSWYGIEYLAGKINELSVVEASESVPRVLCAMAILLPPAVTIGMSFPWAIRIHARGKGDAAVSSAKVYAWNTVGAVLGAFVTGTYLLPMTNYQIAMTIALVANLVLAGLMFTAAKPKLLHLMAIVAALITGIFLLPSQPDELLRVSPFQNYVRLGNLDFVKTGRSGTVTMHNNAGRYSFSTNGLPEAGARPKGELQEWNSAPRWLGVLPGLLRPDAKSMLIVGFGGGVAVANTPESFKEIDVFELEEGMIEANRIVATKRDQNPLADQRVNVILNDGRSGLALTNKKYDAIVSQPSHPWTAGASHLYTREFAQEVRAHLTDEGVFLLWMDSQFADVEIFRSLGATLGDTFPFISLFRPNRSTLLFVGSMASLDLGNTLPVPSNEDDQLTFRHLGMHAKGALIAMRALDDASLRRLCEGATATTDNNNVLALRQVESTEIESNEAAINSLVNKYDVLANSSALGSIAEGVDRTTIACRRQLMERTDNATRIVDSIDNESDRWLAKGYLAMLGVDTERALYNFRKSAEADSPNPRAWLCLYMFTPNRREAEGQGVDYSSIRNKVDSEDAVYADAVEAMRSGDLARIREGDTALAKMPASDSLYNAATLVRIQWRDTQSDAGSMMQRGRENLELINLVAPYVQAKDLAMFRLKAAMYANRPYVALSTAQAVADSIRSEYRPLAPESDGSVVAESADLAALRLQLLNCLTAISSIEGNRGVPASRFYGVRLYVQTHLQELEEQMARQGN